MSGMRKGRRRREKSPIQVSISLLSFLKKKKEYFPLSLPIYRIKSSHIHVRISFIGLVCRQHNKYELRVCIQTISIHHQHWELGQISGTFGASIFFTYKNEGK